MIHPVDLRVARPNNGIRRQEYYTPAPD